MCFANFEIASDAGLKNGIQVEKIRLHLVIDGLCQQNTQESTIVPNSKQPVQLKLHLSKQLSSKARTDICSTTFHTGSAKNAVTNAPFTHYIYVDEVYATSENGGGDK